ncbi:MAG: hypothetical protein P8X50_10355, partial [Maritimibacter sp.]
PVDWIPRARMVLGGRQVRLGSFQPQNLGKNDDFSTRQNIFLNPPHTRLRKIMGKSRKLMGRTQDYGQSYKASEIEVFDA